MDSLERALRIMTVMVCCITVQSEAKEPTGTGERACTVFALPCSLTCKLPYAPRLGRARQLTALASLDSS